MHSTLRLGSIFLVFLLTACDSSSGTELGGAKKAGTEWKPVWSDVANALLRPGSLIGTPGSSCTAGFLFVDPVTRSYYLGTAAHCADGVTSEDGTGIRVSVETTIGTVVTLPQTSMEIGTVVFDSDNPELQQQFGVEDAVDFALVLLDPDINLIAHPQVVSIEAPTGFVDCPEITLGDRMSYYGHGLGYGVSEPTRKREGIMADCQSGIFAAYPTPIFGDSGGPTVYNAGGKALGITSAIDIGNILPGAIIGCTIPYALREAAKAGFGNVALATMDGGFAGLNDTQ